MNCRRALGVLMAVGVAGAIALDGPDRPGAQASDPTRYFLRHFDRVVPLQLDAGELAVRASGLERPGAGAVLPDLGVSLQAHGVVEEPGERVGIGNFVRARVVEVGESAEAQELATRKAVADLAADPAFAFVSPVFIDGRGLPLIITDEILVGLRAAEAHGRAFEAFAAQGLTIVERDFAGLAGVYLLRSSSRNGFEVLEQANALAIVAGVLYSEPNAVIRGQTTGFVAPNDPLFPLQWALDQANNIDMDAPEAWEISIGDSSIVTAILDVGVQFDHPDLNNAPGADFATSVPNGGPANQFDNHGTPVAGCVSGILNNSIGIVGGAPGTRTASVKMGVSTNALGFFDSSAGIIASALNWSLTSGARITNSSFTFFPSATIETAYASTRAQGLIHFAASGNDGGGFLTYPALLPSVNAVGAITPSGERASFSQSGVGLQFVAPGFSIPATDRTGSAGFDPTDYALLAGTSFASPYAASVAALILSINPALNVTQVEQIMRDTAVDLGAPGYDVEFGWGLVNLHHAAVEAQQTVLAPWCAADFNNDGVIGFGDIVFMLSNFGCVTGPNPCVAATGTPVDPGPAGCPADRDCERLVCAVAPGCCSSSWFEGCGNLAAILCSPRDCARTDLTGDGVTDLNDVNVVLMGLGMKCERVRK